MRGYEVHKLTKHSFISGYKTAVFYKPQDSFYTARLKLSVFRHSLLGTFLKNIPTGRVACHEINE